MRFVSILIASVITLCLTGISFADNVKKDKWSGLYIGLGGGYGNLKGDVDVLAIDALDLSETVDTEVGYFTATVGYDQKITQRFLIGVFAEFDASNFEDATLTQWSLGGRVGYLATDDLLLFMSAGYTNAKVADMLFEELGYAELDWLTDENKINFPRYDGWFIGAGAEYMLGSGWSLRGEYRYSRFKQKTLNLPEASFLWGAVSIDTNDIADVSAEGDTHIFRFTANYRF